MDPPLSALATGVALGPYRVVDTLAAGGMGVIYRARHEATRELVAIKTIKAADPSLSISLRREIHALRRIEHPGVVRILAEGVEGGAPWYAMELIAGHTLRQHLARWWGTGVTDGDATLFDSRPGPLADGTGEIRLPAGVRRAAGGHLAEALALVRGLCQALAYLHGEGIVHRDLKPENIVVRADGTPVLVDFGLASTHGGASGRDSLEVAGKLEGSVAYISPEQIWGRLLDAHADLYSLGCILYEILTGEPPFLNNGYTTIRHHLSTSPVPVSAYVAEVPHALEELVRRLLAKRPADRLGFAADVDAALAALAIASPYPDPPRPKAYLYRPEFAGRVDLLERLDRQLDEARDGRGAMVLVRGESGAGKTRLAAELASQANARDMRVIVGECTAVGGAREDAVHGAALHPLRGALQAIADHCVAHGADEARRLLGDDAPVLAVFEPALATFAGGDDPLAALAPQAARERVLAAFATVLAAFARTAPLLLVIDDLQWADELSTALLRALARGVLADAPLFVLATYRGEEKTAAIEGLREDADEVVLGGLDAPTIATMAAHMLALPALPARFAQFLAERSSGNPFFVAEYLRLALQVGLLARRGGGWMVVDERLHPGELEASLPLPRSLGELIGSRLAPLSPAGRGAAEVAAVLGREVLAAELLGAAGLVDAAGLEAIEELIVGRVIDDVGGGKLRFVHDKLRESVYAAIEPPRRRALHRAVADVLEAAPGVHTRAELANHCFLGGELGRARDHYAAAGEHAHRVAAHADAVEHLERALALADATTSRDARVRWARLLAEASLAAGDYARGERYATRAIEDAGRALPKTPAAWARLALRETAVQTAHRFGRAPGGHDPRLADAARAAGVLAEVLYWRQQVVPMTCTVTLAVNLAEQAGHPGEASREYAKLAYLLGVSRAHGLARRYFARAEASADRKDARAFVAFMDSMYGVVFGHWDASARSAERALALFKEAGDPQGIELALTMCAQADYYRGEAARTLPRFAAVRAAAHARGHRVHDAWGAYATARSLIPLGRFDEAIALARESAELLRGQGDRPSEMISHGLLAHAALERGDLATATTAARRTRELWAGTSPTVYSEGHGYEGAARVFLATGDLVAARDAVAMLARFARMFPLARPAALRTEGALAARTGRTRVARARWTASLAHATRLEMAWEAAQTRALLTGSP